MGRGLVFVLGVVHGNESRGGWIVDSTAWSDDVWNGRIWSGRMDMIDG